MHRSAKPSPRSDSGRLTTETRRAQRGNNPFISVPSVSLWLLSILIVVLLSADVAVGAFELSLKAFALSGVEAVPSRESLIDADFRLLCFESSGFDAREFAISNSLTDADLFALLPLVNRLCRRSNR